MKLIKSKRFKGKYILVSCSNFDIKGLIELKEEIEEVLELEHQELLKKDIKN